jgi:hypothetical protein
VLVVVLVLGMLELLVWILHSSRSMSFTLSPWRQLLNRIEDDDEHEIF